MHNSNCDTHTPTALHIRFSEQVILQKATCVIAAWIVLRTWSSCRLMRQYDIVITSYVIGSIRVNTLLNNSRLTAVCKQQVQSVRVHTHHVDTSPFLEKTHTMYKYNHDKPNQSMQQFFYQDVSTVLYASTFLFLCSLNCALARARVVTFIGKVQQSKEHVNYRIFFIFHDRNTTLQYRGYCPWDICTLQVTITPFLQT